MQIYNSKIPNFSNTSKLHLRNMEFYYYNSANAIENIEHLIETKRLKIAFVLVKFQDFCITFAELLQLNSFSYMIQFIGNTVSRSLNS